MISLYPIIIILPFADSFITDNHHNILPVIKTRTKMKKYYFSKMICVFLGAVIVLLIPILLNMLLNAITFPPTSIADFANGVYGQGYVGALKGFAYPYLMANHPYLYNLLFTAILCLFSGLVATAIYCISFFLKKADCF